MFPAAVLLVLAAALLSPGLFIGPSLDPSIFTHVADQMSDGATLYVDTWDHKPPGIYLVYVAGQLILPFLDKWVVTWLLSVAATAGTGVVLSAILRRLDVGRGAALLASAGAVAAMAQYLAALGGGLTEPIAALPLSLALLLSLSPPVSSRRPIAIGLLLGASVLIAIPALPGALAVATLGVLHPGQRVRVGASILVGGVATLALVGTWLAWSGATTAALDAIVGYSAAYRATNDETGVRLSAPVATWTTLSFLFLLAPAILGALAARHARGSRRLLTAACLIWVGAALVLFAFQGRFFAHYAIPLAIPLGILAGLGLERVDILRRRTARPMGVVLLTLPLAVSLLISIGAGIAGAAMEASPVVGDHARSRSIAEAIRPETNEDDAIWVWGNETQIYLVADRPSATRYTYLYPLVTPGYSTPLMVAEVLAQLEADPPLAVIDAGSEQPGLPGFQQLLIARPMASDGRNLDILDPLRDFIRDRYRLGPTVDGWVVYWLLAGSESAED